MNYTPKVRQVDVRPCDSWMYLFPIIRTCGHPVQRACNKLSNPSREILPVDVISRVSSVLLLGAREFEGPNPPQHYLYGDVLQQVLFATLRLDRRQVIEGHSTMAQTQFQRQVNQQRCVVL